MPVLQYRSGNTEAGKVMSIFVGVLFLPLSAFVVYQIIGRQLWTWPPILWAALILKIVAGISLGLVYTYYYEVGDSFGFFEDARKLTALFSHDVAAYFNFLWSGDDSFSVFSQLTNIQARSLFLVKVVSIVSLFSMNNYWIVSFYFSLISFFGALYLVKKIVVYFPQQVDAAVVGFLFVPSVLFWGSGIVKETPALASVSFLAGFFLVLIFRAKPKRWEWLVLALAGFLLWNLKYYWAALFFPSAISTLIIYRLMNASYINSALPSVAAWVFIFVMLGLGVSFIHPNFYLTRFLEVIADNHDAFVAAYTDGPFVHFSHLQPSWQSIVANSPWALISGLYRPFLGETPTVFHGLMAIENFFLFLLTLYNLRHLPVIVRSPYRLIIMGMLCYIFLLIIFLTLSTPNLGTLSRYRIGSIPFLFFLLLCKFPFAQLKARLKISLT